jgi:hypothetical protein
MAKPVRASAERMARRAIATVETRIGAARQATPAIPLTKSSPYQL